MKKVSLIAAAASALLLGCLMSGCAKGGGGAPASSEPGIESSAAIQPSETSTEGSSAAPATTVSSPIPDKDDFIEKHNQAAEALGGGAIHADGVQPLKWGSGQPVEGGFMCSAYSFGSLIFDPAYVQIAGTMEDASAAEIQFAAVASAITGAAPEEALAAMKELAASAKKPENVEEGASTAKVWTTWMGVDFSLEVGPDSNVAVFKANDKAPR